jgi:hypothetical protein
MLEEAAGRVGRAHPFTSGEKEAEAMALEAKKVQVWAAGIEDRPGGLAAKLEALAKAGAALEFVIARRAPEKPGTGVVFVAPLAAGKQEQAAQAAGFTVSESLHSVRVEGADKPGMGAKLARALAQAGINLRGLSAAAIGSRFVCYLALDSAGDAEKAIGVLKKL